MPKNQKTPDRIIPSRYSRARVNDRTIDELIGICHGVLFDGSICQTEAEHILRWLDTHRGIADQWPANILYRRIGDMLTDGLLDDDEQRELLALLTDITGDPTHNLNQHSASTRLPLDDPPPPITFRRRHFCLTGMFVSGPRGVIKSVIEQHGGAIKKTVTIDTDYLLVGEIASRDWIHPNFGRKIETAIAHRASGRPIAIISEQHWLSQITRNP